MEHAGKKRACAPLISGAWTCSLSARNGEEDTPISGTKVHIQADTFDSKKKAKLHISYVDTENVLHSGFYDEAHEKIVLKDGFRGRFVRGNSKDQLVFWREHDDDKDESMTFERATISADVNELCLVDEDAEYSKRHSLEKENVPPDHNPTSSNRAPGPVWSDASIQPPLVPQQEKPPRVQSKFLNDSDATDEEVLAVLSGGAAIEEDLTAEAAVSEEVVPNDMPDASDDKLSPLNSQDSLFGRNHPEPVVSAGSPSEAEGAEPEALKVDDSEIPEESEATEDEDDSEIFAEYVPAFAPTAFSSFAPKAHPSSLVETASLTAVRTKPPSFPLEHSLGPVASAGLLSAAQLESGLCACEAHSWHIRAADKSPVAVKDEACMRAGFSLGDGAGDLSLDDVDPYCRSLCTQLHDVCSLPGM